MCRSGMSFNILWYTMGQDLKATLYTKHSKLCLYFVGIDHRVYTELAGYYTPFPLGRPVIAGWRGQLRRLCMHGSRQKMASRGVEQVTNGTTTS